PPGVEAPDVACTIASICENLNRLGATASFDVRQNPSNTNQTIVATLTHQLSARYPPYRKLITQTMMEEPNIFRLNLRSQFKKLIAEPWARLRITHPIYTMKPPLILVGQSGHCNHVDTNLIEFIDLISGCHYLSQDSPLLWLVRIPPSVPTMMRLCSQSPYPTRFECAYLFPDDGEARDDVDILHYKAFSRVRRNHSNTMLQNGAWQTEEQPGRLENMSSDAHDFAEAVLRFINCKGSCSPQTNLGSPIPSTYDPTNVVDRFYYTFLTD
ncbi:hypothetical protein P691DRAFT_815117, partial [Macrolepiota fuliginosa MF-IS2]